MKTLTTLTAIAALVAGVSVAQAQMGSPPSGSACKRPRQLEIPRSAYLCQRAAA